LKFGEVISFFKAKESYFNTNCYFNDPLPICVGPSATDKHGKISWVNSAVFFSYTKAILGKHK